MKMVLLLIYAFVVNAKANETVTQSGLPLLQGNRLDRKRKSRNTHTCIHVFTDLFFFVFFLLL